MFALQPELKVFSGSANRDLAERICKYVGVPLGQATISSFPDGETYVRIEKTSGARRIHYSADFSANQSALDGVANHGGCGPARKRGPDHGCDSILWIRASGPQGPTTRPITAKLVANLLYRCGVSRVLTMDLHAQQVQGFLDIPVDHLYSLPVLIKYLRKRLTGKTTVVSPDLGGLKMASAYAEALGANLAIVAKERKSATQTEALYLIGDVEGSDVLLVDDLTETAGTLTSATELLKKRGARDVWSSARSARRCRHSAFAKIENYGISYHQQHPGAHRGRV